MKIKQLLLFICMVLMLNSCSFFPNRVPIGGHEGNINGNQIQDVIDENDIIEKLKTYDNTSPYTYESEYEGDNGTTIIDRISYNESTKKFTSFHDGWTVVNGVITNTNVTITWAWGYLEDASINFYFHNSDIDNGGIVKLKITDITFGQFPAIDTYNYTVTYNSGYPESRFFVVLSYAKSDMFYALRFANTFCTGVDGSLSIR